MQLNKQNIKSEHFQFQTIVSYPSTIINMLENIKNIKLFTKILTLKTLLVIISIYNEG